MGKSYRHLKSGTDVRGVAVGENLTLTDEAVCAISRAFVKWLSSKSGKTSFKIAVGNDSRISAKRILSCVKEGILSSGSNLVYTGLSSTPSMFILLKKSDMHCDASIMITASHLPYDRNGLKFFTPDGGLDSSDIDEILSIAEKEDFLSGNGKYFEKSFMDEYSNLLVETVRKSCSSDKPLKGKRIIVDAGNGAGGFFTEKVLKPLGADTSGSQFLEPDGYFPNHIPNPEDKEAIDSIKKATVKYGADLGIIFDTDVDRAGAVDSNGKEINRNRLIAMLSAILLKDKKGVIVTDSVTSDGLKFFIESLGGKHLRYMRGYKNVINKCKELNAKGEYSPLAIETSGHAAFMENYFLDDGAYVITKLLISLATLKDNEKLTDLIAGLPEPIESDEIRISFSDTADFREKGADVIKGIEKRTAKDKDLRLSDDNYEGVRVNFGKGLGDGWFLLRMSLHDTVMPINLESSTPGGNKIIAEKLLNMLSSYSFLNTENLYKFIHKL
ncbi:MAG: phosphomannomutase/phosphoglucomutase [Clostridia bacterium]|nr:phosphomannomutase/phosphoglucomutase [Clostridia bacterium]